MKICAIIPTYNHTQSISYVVDALRKNGLKVFIINDGSSDFHKEIISGLQTDDKTVEVTHLPVNHGKGGAVKAGFLKAYEAGYTHALQIDADGQHDVQAIPQLLLLAQQFPDDLITGVPVYDSSAPLGRKIGRWITHVWVWIETLSLRIKDSMCGFRVYPLKATTDLLKNQEVGNYMDFDTDIMVRLYWAGVNIYSLPVKVIYPEDNTSNFAMFKDNCRISLMHTKLVLTMLCHLRSVITRKMNVQEQHWSSIQERGTYYGLAFCSASYRILGPRVNKFIYAMIAFYFFVFGITQRKAIEKFLAKVLGRKPKWTECYKNFCQFSFRALDIMSAWHRTFPAEKINVCTPEVVRQLAVEKSGALLVVSHLGNADFSRAILSDEMLHRLTLLVHSKNALSYNKALKKICPQAMLNMMQITDIGPHTIMDLQDRLEKGAYICIAGDRTPMSGDHAVNVNFFNEQALFPQGPWILGSLLKCPVYLLFCTADEKGKYSLYIEKFADEIALGRRDRNADIANQCQLYAARLEHYAALTPHQWFNFYDFWGRPS